MEQDNQNNAVTRFYKGFGNTLVLLTELVALLTAGFILIHEFAPILSKAGWLIFILALAFPLSRRAEFDVDEVMENFDKFMGYEPIEEKPVEQRDHCFEASKLSVTVK